MKRKTMLLANVLYWITTPIINVSMAGMIERSGDPELIRLAAMALQDNKERIVTWKCDVEMKTEYVGKSGKVEIKREGNGSVLIDREFDAVRWLIDVHVDEYLRPEGQINEGVQSSMPLPYKSRGMITPELYYDQANGVYADGRGEASQIIIWPRDQYKPVQRFTNPNPLDYMEMSLSFSNYSQLMNIHNVWLGKDDRDSDIDASFSVVRAGDIIKISVSRNYEDPPAVYRAEFDCDMSKGGNVVRHYKRSTKVTSPFEYEKRWKYVKANGLWVPESFLHIRNDLTTSKRTTHKEYAFSNHVLNKTVDRNEFRLEKLELLPDTRIVDRIKNISFLYAGVGEMKTDDFKMLEGFLPESEGIQTMPQEEILKIDPAPKVVAESQIAISANKGHVSDILINKRLIWIVFILSVALIIIAIATRKLKGSS